MGRQQPEMREGQGFDGGRARNGKPAAEEEKAKGAEADRPCPCEERHPVKRSSGHLCIHHMCRDDEPSRAFGVCLSKDFPEMFTFPPHMWHVPVPIPPLHKPVLGG